MVPPGSSVSEHKDPWLDSEIKDGIPVLLLGNHATWSKLYGFSESQFHCTNHGKNNFLPHRMWELMTV